MKTLLLTDETYTKLVSDPKARALLAPKLDDPVPEAEGLHEAARADEAPDVFRLQRARLEAVTDAASEIRERMHSLIRTAHARGIGPTYLSRWTGYTVTRIYQIVDGRPTPPPPRPE